MAVLHQRTERVAIVRTAAHFLACRVVLGAWGARLIAQPGADQCSNINSGLDPSAPRSGREETATSASGSPLCHPCRSGAGQPRVCDRFGAVFGSGRAYAGEGSGSRLDRRSTRVAGVVLTPIPGGAESVRREQGFWGCGWPCSPGVRYGRVWRNRGAPRLPVIPSPRRRGAAWSATAAARRGQSKAATAPRGGQTQNGLAPGCAGKLGGGHAAGARQRMWPSRSP